MRIFFLKNILIREKETIRLISGVVNTTKIRKKVDNMPIKGIGNKVIILSNITIYTSIIYGYSIYPKKKNNENCAKYHAILSVIKSLISISNNFISM